MQLKLLVMAGNAKPGPALSQQLGPAGINMGKLITEVNNASKEFSGMKVPVIVDVDTDTKSFELTVKKPPVGELIKKELGLEKGAGPKKKVGNLAVEQAVKIAIEKEEDMLTGNFKNAVKNVAATCTSLGILVEGKEPKLTNKRIEQGEFDSIINNKVTEVTAEKKQTLATQLEKVIAVLERRLKAEEAEKEVEKAKAPAADAKEGENKEGAADAKKDSKEAEKAKDPKAKK